jgi:hypothetical protein
MMRTALFYVITQQSCLETSAENYRYLLRNNPEELGSLLRGGSLKSCIPSMTIAYDGRREDLTGIVKSSMVT